MIATEHHGRVATVVTEAGSRVTVLGGDPDVRSSLDRRYAVGAFYEFHPTNATSPYRANTCTHTEKLWGPKPPDFGPDDGALSGWLPENGQTGWLGYGLLLATAVVGALIIGSEVRRHRS